MIFNVITQHSIVHPETHTKRRGLSTAVGDKGIEIVYGEEKNIFYWTDYSIVKAEKKSLVPARQPIEPTREGPLSFVLF